MASTVIEENLTIEGNIKSGAGSVEVKGKVIGDVTAQSVTVHQGGSVRGTMSAQSVAVEGEHSGRLQCEDLKLAATSNVKADVSARTMSTESGARVEGAVKVSGSAGQGTG